MTVIHTDSAASRRDVAVAMLRGARLRCPGCGTGALFRRYLKVAPSCGRCEEALHHHRADDAPAYFTIFIVGHLLVPIALAVEQTWQPPLTLQLAVWLPLALGTTLMLLPVVKGVIVALQWALRMHGFEDAGGGDAEPAALPYGTTAWTTSTAPEAISSASTARRKVSSPTPR